MLPIVIPAIAFGLAHWAAADLAASLAARGISSLERACEGAVAHVYAEIFPAILQICAERRNIQLTERAAGLIAVGSVALPLLMLAFAKLAGSNRVLLAAIFPPLTLFSGFALAAICLTQAALLIAACLTSGPHLVGVGVAVRIAIGVAIGAALAAFFLVRAILSMTRPMVLPVLGKTVVAADAPTLTAFVASLAQRVGAPAPSTIVLGLEPTFFVTSACVHVIDANKPLTGETLFVSLPLARFFSKEEFAAVIGHELGHFRGHDTYYSRRFAPVYVGLQQALVGMIARNTHIVALPAFFSLGALHDVFSRSTAVVSRARELEADKAGAECAPADALGSALAKTVYAEEAWSRLGEIVFDEHRGLRLDANLSRRFADLAKRELDAARVAAIVGAMGEATTHHPIDTHPPIAERLQALGLAASDLRIEMPSEGTSAIALIDDADRHESALTLVEHRRLAATGPSLDATAQTRFRADAGALLAARLVLASGPADERVAGRVEDIAGARLRGFDNGLFRRALATSHESAEFATLASVALSITTDDGRLILKDFLDAVVHSALSGSPEAVRLLAQTWEADV
ncbi:MAG: M48 family metalloprotease [Hyphomonadaceae bacterium]|nr:M48 family metalloprotease [Hyphomonadaceae bacterium]